MVFIYFGINSKMADIQCVFEGVAGKGSIFISNFEAAEDILLLQTMNIKAIISVARSGQLHHSREQIPHYLYIPAQDHEDYEIYRHFNQTFEFIQQARKESNVLVHCMAGVSRSVTIVMAYLLKKYKTSLNEVISMLQRKRRKINPNKGFIQQLKKYAKEEGLKCDFNEPDLSKFRERSAGHKRILSNSVQRKTPKFYQLPGPLEKKLYLGQGQKSQPIQSSTRTKVNSEEIKQEKCQNKKKVEKQEEEKPKREIKLLKKSSFDCHTGSKRLSIEEKIELMRQKMNRSRQSPKKQIIDAFTHYQTEVKQNRQLSVANSEQCEADGSSFKSQSLNQTLSSKESKNLQLRSTEIFKQERQVSPQFLKTDLDNEYCLKSENLYERLKNPKSKKGFRKGNN